MTAHGTRYRIEGEQLTVAQVAARLGISAPAASGRIKRASERHARLTWAALGVGAPPSRQQRMLHFIAGLGRPATLDEVFAAVAAHEPDAERSQLANAVAAQLSQLSKAGKLTRIGVRNAFTYQPTATTLLDGRGRAGRWKQAKAKAPKAPKPARPKPEPVAKAAKPKAAAAKPAKPAAPATPPPRRVGEFRIVDKPAPAPVPNANLVRPREAALDSAQIAADVAAFQARGGAVQRLPNGLTSQPTKAFLAAQAAARRPRPSNADTFDADAIEAVA